MIPLLILATLLSQSPRPKPPGEDWVPLFNGKDLTGWVNVGHEKWEVENGTLHGLAITKDYGYLQTEKSYKDFQLSLRFKCEGDGMLTALRVLDVMKKTGQDLDTLTSAFVSYPQLLVNVRVKERRPLSELASVNEGIARVQAEFGDQGRVLVRFSGTEPLARVMVEGPAADRVAHHANQIADAIGRELGVA